MPGQIRKIRRASIEQFNVFMPANLLTGMPRKFCEIYVDWRCIRLSSSLTLLEELGYRP